MKGTLLTLFLGLIPEAIYFALFMIFTKNLKKHKFLFMVTIIFEYIIAKIIFPYSIWFQVAFIVLFYAALKAIFPKEARITDIFTLGISSFILIGISFITYILLRSDMIIAAIANRICLFLVLFIFKNDWNNIEKLYLKIWNRNDKVPKKIKSTTFRTLNIVLLNFMIYFLDLGVSYTMMWK